jgi:hypothetical protein
MSVPEASVHKNASTVFLQYNIGRTREFLYMDTETVSVSEKEFPHDYLWLRVLATDTCHAPVALFGSEFVWHGTNVHERLHFPKKFRTYPIIYPFLGIL